MVPDHPGANRKKQFPGFADHKQHLLGDFQENPETRKDPSKSLFSCLQSGEQEPGLAAVFITSEPQRELLKSLLSVLVGLSPEVALPDHVVSQC